MKLSLVALVLTLIMLQVGYLGIYGAEKHRCAVGLLRFCFCFISLPRDVGLIFSLDRQFRYEADSVCATG